MSVRNRVNGFVDTDVDDSTLVGVGLILPAILLIAGILLWPFVQAVWMSFLNVDTTEVVGLEHYRWLFGAGNFWSYTIRTIAWTFGNLALQGFFGVTIALALNRAFPGRNLLRTAILVPFVIPTAVTAILWRWLFNGSWGPINTYLQDLGLISQPITPFIDPTLALAAVTFVNAWRWIPLVALIVFAVLQTIPEEQYEAARLEGAGFFQEFYHVTYPHLSSALSVLGLLGFLITFNIFDMIWLLTNGGPGSATTTLPVWIYETAFNLQAIGRGNAISVVLFLLLSVFVLVFFWRNTIIEEETA